MATIIDYFIADIKDIKLQKHHQLLLRAGLVSQIGNGLNALMPLGMQAINNIKDICLEEMKSIGCQQIDIPALLPLQLIKTSGRDLSFGSDIYYTDNHYLAPTHEESILVLMKSFIKSYRDLPLHMLQINHKFRKEARSKGLLIRSQQFLMQDSYHFVLDAEDGHTIYEQTKQAYKRIFNRLEIPYIIVQADASSMKGEYSEEIHYLTDIGDDFVAISSHGYAANLDVALVTPKLLTKDIQELYYQIDDGRLLNVLIPQSRSINNHKLAHAFNYANMSSVSYVDRAPDIILKDQHIDPTGADLTLVQDNDLAPDGGVYTLHRGIEIGHIFNLGTYYSDKFNLSIHNANNERQKVNMGCYGIGITRLLSIILTEHGFDKYICWPKSVMPIKPVIIIPQDHQDPLDQKRSKDLSYLLQKQGIDVDVYDKPTLYKEAVSNCLLKGCLCVLVLSSHSNKIKIYTQSDNHVCHIDQIDSLLDIIGRY